MAQETAERKAAEREERRGQKKRVTGDRVEGSWQQEQTSGQTAANLMR